MKVCDIFPHVVMEYADGGTLEDFMKQQKQQQQQQQQQQTMLVMFAQLVSAVSHAHSCGILHRDIKPANVMLHTCTGGSSCSLSVKLCDFGLAKRLSSSDSMAKTLCGMRRRRQAVKKCKVFEQARRFT
jgi:serine/threonine protein kinase